ncbi:hypothetical protein HMPREF0539_0588 [Lacticaseibacillus rhamnosus LMS2-1]|uniref:Uncharacterized protein n=1 Tax=Lacticaseibacillus rhamnosus (strain LMS2-1) TaxID=525361 RepID=C2JUK4_LACRM|nr:hypothetical protein HMPREF0539_0588 [Lacticaseibacillus rhamnosus LMS2-1]
MLREKLYTNDAAGVGFKLLHCLNHNYHQKITADGSFVSYERSICFFIILKLNDMVHEFSGLMENHWIKPSRRKRYHKNER